MQLGPGRGMQGSGDPLHPAHAAQGCSLPLGGQKEAQELELSSMAIIKLN